MQIFMATWTKTDGAGRERTFVQIDGRLILVTPSALARLGISEDKKRKPSISRGLS